MLFAEILHASYKGGSQESGDGECVLGERTSTIKIMHFIKQAIVLISDFCGHFMSQVSEFGDSTLEEGKAAGPAPLRRGPTQRRERD